MPSPTFTIKQIGALINIWEKKVTPTHVMNANIRTLNSLYKRGLITTTDHDGEWFWILTQKGDNYMFNAMNNNLRDNFQYVKPLNDNLFSHIRRKKLRKFPKELII